MRKLNSQTEYIFSFRLLSPLLIGSIETLTADVGAADKSTVVNPITDPEEPLIPPASIKGKMRYAGYLLGYDENTLNKYLGSPKAKDGPPAINIKSVRMISKPVSALKDTLFTKTEASISRLNGEANPRFFRPASPHTIFECRLHINIYDTTVKESDVINFIEQTIRMLEDNYIGGSGSRGYGRIKIINKSKVDTANREFDISLTADDLKEKEETVYLNSGFFSNNKIQSSTLAGLFAYALADMGREDLIPYIYNGGGFLVSSAFPCIETGGNKIHFFPRPLWYVKGVKTHEKNKKKFLYDFQYISETLLTEFFKDTKCIKTWCDELGSSYKTKDNMLMTSEEYNPLESLSLTLTASADLMHVSIDPNTGSPKKEEATDKGKGILFSTHDHFYSKDFRFFFLVKHRFKDIQPILRRIEQLGIGRDKSTGMGYFNFEVKAGSILKHANPDGSRYFSLSLIHPDENDRKQLSDDTYKNSYSVITRKGKRENNSFSGAGDFRAEKDKIFMFKEGSIFGFPIKGSSPVVYSKCEEGYEIKDFGYIYSIRF